MRCGSCAYQLGKYIVGDRKNSRELLKFRRQFPGEADPLIIPGIGCVCSIGGYLAREDQKRFPGMHVEGLTPGAENAAAFDHIMNQGIPAHGRTKAMAGRADFGTCLNGIEIL